MDSNYINFTIAIPAYKKTYLKECIDSILKQTFSNFEIIIVNDNSPEDIENVINKFNDSRIKYYKNKRGFGAYNVVKNWNKCLEYAEGEYIICMGDDDRLLPYCLENYISLINKYPELNIYHTRTEIIDSKSNIIDIQEPRPEYESVYSAMWYRWNGRKQYIGDFLFKTSTLRKNGGFFCLPTGCCSDDISVWIASKDKGIANTLEFGFQYRDNQLTLSRNQSNMKDKVEAFKLAKQWYISFLDNYSSCSNIDLLYKDKLKKTLNGYIYNFYNYCTKTDIQQHGIRSLFFWIRNRKKYGLNPFILIKYYYEYLI